MNARDKDRYLNDDYTPFAGPDYHNPKHIKRSDEQIYEEVCQILRKSPDVIDSRIEVRVHAGSVLLAGYVPNKLAKELAAYLVEELAGVQSVLNELQVDHQEGHQ